MSELFYWSFLCKHDSFKEKSTRISLSNSYCLPDWPGDMGTLQLFACKIYNYVSAPMYMYRCIYTIPPPKAGCDSWSISSRVQQVWIEFFFSQTGFLTNDKIPVCLEKWRRTNWFMHFPRVLARNKMQTVSFRFDVGPPIPLLKPLFKVCHGYIHEHIWMHMCECLCLYECVWPYG